MVRLTNGCHPRIFHINNLFTSLLITYSYSVGFGNELFFLLLKTRLKSLLLTLSSVTGFLFLMTTHILPRGHNLC